MKYLNFKGSIIFILLLIPILSSAQTTWKSLNCNYNIEIPKGFTKTSSVIGVNVDFKAINGNSSIVVVVTTIPFEYSSYSIWDIMGDLTTFETEWELGANEHMINPQFLKFGKTTMSNLPTFWYDYTTDQPKLYSKIYQAKKGDKLFTITLTCPNVDYNLYSPIWIRFKNSINIY